MATQLIHDDRIQRLNDLDSRSGKYVLYWMQQSQRARTNHALEYAVRRANDCNLPLLVGFGLVGNYPDACLRHYHFMLQGLQEVENSLRRRGIAMVVRKSRDNPAETAIDLAKSAAEVVCDRGYLRHQRQWREKVAEESDCRVWQVESDTIVPVEIASNKSEYAARTIRSKLNEKVDQYCDELATTAVERKLSSPPPGIDLSNVKAVLDDLKVDNAIQPSAEFQGGTSQAKARLNHFLSDSLNQYDQPEDLTNPHVSTLSPYLHFGQISPLDVVSAVRSKRGVRVAAKEAFLEELIVRRELAANFVYHESSYDSLQCLPDWASQTLLDHEDDPREHHYTATELEAAETHDAAWNAAMTEMKHRGFLHNRLRMYWGKKIIEWTNTTAHAYRTALDLNNRYFIDGRDPNSYANIAWLFGMHDRPHQERPIFGKVRYMSADGLRRKIDVDAYIKSVEERFAAAEIRPENA